MGDGPRDFISPMILVLLPSRMRACATVSLHINGDIGVHFWNYVILQETVQNWFENSKKAKGTEIEGRKEWPWHMGSSWGVCKALFLELGAGHGGVQLRVICLSSTFMGFVLFDMCIVFHDFKRFVSTEVEVGG